MHKISEFADPKKKAIQDQINQIKELQIRIEEIDDFLASGKEDVP
ncbi:hypothetical protein [Halobacillus hunanensis]|nr:hypothetical protein [Halobacillus hunanensis]